MKQSLIFVIFEVKLANHKMACTKQWEMGLSKLHLSPVLELAQCSLIMIAVIHANKPSDRLVVDTKTLNNEPKLGTMPKLL